MRGTILDLLIPTQDLNEQRKGRKKGINRCGPRDHLVETTAQPLAQLTTKGAGEKTKGANDLRTRVIPKINGHPINDPTTRVTREVMEEAGGEMDPTTGAVTTPAAMTLLKKKHQRKMVMRAAKNRPERLNWPGNSWHMEQSKGKSRVS